MFTSKASYGPAVTSIVVAAGEVGSGTARAAGGKHFSNLTPRGVPGHPDQHVRPQQQRPIRPPPPALRDLVPTISSSGLAGHKGYLNERRVAGTQRNRPYPIFSATQLVLRSVRREIQAGVCRRRSMP